MPEADGSTSARADALSNRIIGACIEVHRALGPGLLESAYEACLCRELTLAAIGYDRQRPLPVEYKGVALDCGYRLDIVTEDLVVIEIKAVDSLLPVHEAQLLTYLKLTGISLGLLVNFNVPRLREGVKRMVHNFGSSSRPRRPWPRP